MDQEKETNDSSADETEVLEFEFNEDGEEDFKKTLKKLRDDLKNCKKEKEDYLNGWQKERADFINYKKQEEDRKSIFSEALRERILARFLVVLDSFDLAFKNKESWEKIDLNWRQGIEYIYSQIQNIFQEYDVKSIGEIGETFNINFHQSIEAIFTDQKEKDHQIAEIVQRGYKIGDRIIRPAQVKIYEFQEKN